MAVLDHRAVRGGVADDAARVVRTRDAHVRQLHVLHRAADRAEQTGRSVVRRRVGCAHVRDHVVLAVERARERHARVARDIADRRPLNAREVDVGSQHDLLACERVAAVHRVRERDQLLDRRDRNDVKLQRRHPLFCHELPAIRRRHVGLVVVEHGDRLAVLDGRDGVLEGAIEVRADLGHGGRHFDAVDDQLGRIRIAAGKRAFPVGVVAAERSPVLIAIDHRLRALFNRVVADRQRVVGVGGICPAVRSIDDDGNERMRGVLAGRRRTTRKILLVGVLNRDAGDRVPGDRALDGLDKSQQTAGLPDAIGVRALDLETVDLAARHRCGVVVAHIAHQAAALLGSNDLAVLDHDVLRREGVGGAREDTATLARHLAVLKRDILHRALQDIEEARVVLVVGNHQVLNRVASTVKGPREVVNRRPFRARHVHVGQQRDRLPRRRRGKRVGEGGVRRLADLGDYGREDRHARNRHRRVLVRVLCLLLVVPQRTLAVRALGEARCRRLSIDGDRCTTRHQTRVDLDGGLALGRSRRIEFAV